MPRDAVGAVSLGCGCLLSSSDSASRRRLASGPEDRKSGLPTMGDMALSGEVAPVASLLASSSAVSGFEKTSSSPSLSGQ